MFRGTKIGPNSREPPPPCRDYIPVFPTKNQEVKTQVLGSGALSLSLWAPKKWRALMWGVYIRVMAGHGDFGRKRTRYPHKCPTIMAASSIINLLSSFRIHVLFHVSLACNAFLTLQNQISVSLLISFSAGFSVISTLA